MCVQFLCIYIQPKPSLIVQIVKLFAASLKAYSFETAQATTKPKLFLKQREKNDKGNPSADVPHRIRRVHEMPATCVCRSECVSGSVWMCATVRVFSTTTLGYKQELADLQIVHWKKTIGLAPLVKGGEREREERGRREGGRKERKRSGERRERGRKDQNRRTENR